MRKYVPLWVGQLLVAALAVGLAAALILALVGSVARMPGAPKRAAAAD